MLLVYQLRPWNLVAHADKHTHTDMIERWPHDIQQSTAEGLVFGTRQGQNSCSPLLHQRFSTTPTTIAIPAIYQVPTLHSPSVCITLWFFFPFFVLNPCVPCLCPLLYPHVLSAILAPGGQQGLCLLSFLPAAGRLMNQRFHGGSSGVSEGAGMADRLHRTPSKQN